jgi:ribosomal protein L12E/L44/L45/RPP1/RPP2
MGDALRLTVIATGFDRHAPAEDELEQVIRATKAGGPSARATSAASAVRGAQAAALLGGSQSAGAYAREPAAARPTREAPAADRWGRSEAAADPSEIPAFLRRRDEPTMR